MGFRRPDFYEQVGLQGPHIVRLALLHRHQAANEAGIRCLENWKCAEGADLLRKLRYAESWLDEYREAVIRDLEQK